MRNVAFALLSVAVLLLGFGGLPATKRIAQIARPYDRDAAIVLAGKQVPAEIESFYFFVLDTNTSIAQDGDEMAAVLQRAAVEQDYLGIVGPDPERNRATLLHALDAAANQKLDGVIVIYVGPSTQAEEVMQRVSAAGADLRYVVYPDDSEPSI